MTYPKIKACPESGNAAMAQYGYSTYPLNWHVECDECHYLGPCGNKLQSIRLHNARAEQRQIANHEMAEWDQLRAEMDR